MWIKKDASQQVDVWSITVRVEIKMPIKDVQYSSTTAEVIVTRDKKETALQELDEALEHLQSKLQFHEGNESLIEERVSAATEELKAKYNSMISVMRKMANDPRTKEVMTV